MIDLKFESVSKRYRIYEPSDGEAGQPRILRKAQRLLSGRKDFWAVKDVNFEISRGEAVGIIGSNGAGKSTILKLLYSITAPTEGEITIRGRLAALIEVASGFHPELTGRENAYLNGALLGMKRREIDRKLESIIDFAGVARFIDTPVKRYSSGMYLRLGFAIAAHLDPDILLLDEVLAVGDAAFQVKCQDRIKQLKRDGRTIVFVSHNLSAVESLCDRVLLADHGRILMSGPPKEVINGYGRLLSERSATAPQGIEVTKDPIAEVLSISIYDQAGEECTLFSTGDYLRAVVKYKVHQPIKNAAIEVYFLANWGSLHTHFTTEVGPRLDLEPGTGEIEFICPELSLEMASFDIEVAIKLRATSLGDDIDRKHVAVINVQVGWPIHGVYFMPHTWHIRAALNEASEQELVESVMQNVK